MSATGNPDSGNSMDYALIMNMMEYFCFAIKPTRFSGCMTFVFYHEAEGGPDPVDGTEFEVTVTIEKVEAASDKPPGEKDPQRPRVVVTLGGPPEGALCEAKGRARVSYEQFLLVYSGKASAKDIIRMALKRKIKLSGFSASMKFGFSFEYNKPTWTAYYSAKDKASLREEDDEAAHQSRSHQSRSQVAPPLEGMSPLSSPGRKFRREKETVGEEVSGLEGRARPEGRSAVPVTSVNRVLFSSDRFRTVGKIRKLKRQENAEDMEDSAAVSARGAGAKDHDEDDDEGSDGHSEGGSGFSGDGACGGGRRGGRGGGGAKHWVHMSLASWIWRLNEGGRSRGTCCYSSRDDVAEPAFGIRFDPLHSIGRAIICPRRDSYRLVYSTPQLQQLASPFIRAANGKDTPDGALMSLIMAKPTNAFHSSWRDWSYSRLLRRDSAKGSNGDVGGGIDKGGWVENRTSLAAVAGGATAGTMLFLLLSGGRGCGVGADKLRRRLPQLSL